MQNLNSYRFSFSSVLGQKWEWARSREHMYRHKLLCTRSSDVAKDIGDHLARSPALFATREMNDWSETTAIICLPDNDVTHTHCESRLLENARTSLRNFVSVGAWAQHCAADKGIKALVPLYETEGKCNQSGDTYVSSPELKERLRWGWRTS